MTKRNPTRNDLDADTVRELFDYDPETGVLTHRHRPIKYFRDGKLWSADQNYRRWNTRYSGKKAGCVSRGRIVVGVNDILYGAHRVIWLWMTGKWPKEEIDHIDLDPSNNRFNNLREANRIQNQANVRVRADSKSGIKGVQYFSGKGRRKRWSARIKENGKQRTLGNFATAGEAADAYRKAAEELHGEFARS